ncbi:MAG: ParB N-terminal domain-containing protein, partial [Oligoflexia bacterium]|nr:ParB N-terminal domain-containing protein [Oligoflexia bacterium]
MRDMIEKNVNITEIDTQYSFLRIQNKKIEKDLLSSIAEKDIKEPLLGIWSNERFILIDGFKRYRCAIKLHINQVLCRELAQEKCDAFISVLRISNDRTLHILEQAKFLKELC